MKLIVSLSIGQISQITLVNHVILVEMVAMVMVTPSVSLALAGVIIRLVLVNVCLIAPRDNFNIQAALVKIVMEVEPPAVGRIAEIV